MTVTILVVLVAIAVLAPRYGADSRTDDSWTAGRREQPIRARRRTVPDDARAVWRTVTRHARR